MLFIWIACNGAYFFIVLRLSGSQNPQYQNDGSFGPLQGFTCFLAAIVVFRVFFAILYVCKWKCRYCCNKNYKIKTYNLDKNFAKLRADQNDDGHSSDDEEIYQAAKRIYLEREHEIVN